MPDEPALMDEPPYDTYRAMLKFLFKEALDASQLDPKLRQEIEEGRRTFLFDDHGNFIDS